MPGLIRLLVAGLESWLVSDGLKRLTVCRVGEPSGLKADCVLGWRTVWLPLGSEDCWLSRPCVDAAWELVEPGLVQVIGVQALWVKNAEHQ